MRNDLKIIPIFIPHEGCPHSCVFCNQEKITGMSSGISASDVQNTVELYLQSMGKNGARREIAFYGGSFTGLPIERQCALLESVQQYLQKSQIDGIRVSTRPDYIDLKRLQLLKEKGVSTIELGAQSMDDQVLKLSGRGHSSNQTKEAARLIKQMGFSLGIQMMIGLPGDSHETSLRSAQDICALKPDFVRIYPALVLKNTALEKAYFSGYFIPLSLEGAVEICAEVALRFLLAGIKIIRIGLQPTEDISPGAQLIAGPFHPAFGELVDGRIYWFLWLKLLTEIPEFSKHVEVETSVRDYSKAAGHKRENLNKLKEARPHVHFHISTTSNLFEYTLSLRQIDGKRIGLTFSLPDLKTNTFNQA